jgi:hypothetical protein
VSGLQDAAPTGLCHFAPTDSLLNCGRLDPERRGKGAATAAGVARTEIGDPGPCPREGGLARFQSPVEVAQEAIPPISGQSPITTAQDRTSQRVTSPLRT